MTRVQDIVSEVWSLCDILRDDGITYHQYVNELTYLLFLKLAEETHSEDLLLRGCRWSDLVAAAAKPLEQHELYLSMLHRLGTRGRGRVKQIFANPTTFLHHPENLTKLISRINALDWHSVSREGLGDVYEGLLEKNANETKSGAGQYFTPRPLISSIINVLRPRGNELIVDPAAGTCGFLIMAKTYFDSLNSATDESPRFFGVELVRDTHRLALMNALLHGLDGKIELGDTLAKDGVKLPMADLIITNPPFGSKRGAGREMRPLQYPTNNKQLAFLQLIYQSLTPGGRCGVIVPDNVLFEGGVGLEIRKDLLDKCDLHTILRLPTGIFYAPGVKTNVLFFTRGAKDKGNTKNTWIYDLRTNMPSFGKRTPLLDEHFEDFESSYGKKADGTSKRTDSGEDGRFRSFTRDSIAARGDNLDITWLRSSDADSIDMHATPEAIAMEIRVRLASVLEELEALTELLEAE